MHYVGKMQFFFLKYTQLPLCLKQLIKLHSIQHIACFGIHGIFGIFLWYEMKHHTLRLGDRFGPRLQASPLAQQPIVGQGLFVIETSRSNSRHHTG